MHSDRSRLRAIARAALLLLFVCGFGCVRSYGGAPPLQYPELRYESVDGKAWPEKSIALPEIRAQYHLLVDPRVTYVELNPGGARTLIFLHGLGSYLKFWRYQLDTFAARGDRVIAIDMLGYGKSDKPATFPYTMEAMADVVLAVIRRTNADKPVLIGHSMGGQVALSFAIRYPNEASALVLTSPAGFEEFGDREKRWLSKVFTVPLIAGASEYEIWGSVRYNNFYRWKPEYEWLIEERVRTAKNDTFKSYAYANVKSVRGLCDNDFVRSNLGKVTVPTLIVHGDRDRLIPNPFMHGGDTRKVMEYGHTKIRGSRLVTLEDCGHTVQMDCADNYNRAVGDFLSSLPAPAPAEPHPAPAPAPGVAPPAEAPPPSPAPSSSTGEPASD